MDIEKSQLQHHIRLELTYACAFCDFIGQGLESHIKSIHGPKSYTKFLQSKRENQIQLSLAGGNDEDSDDDDDDDDIIGDKFNNGLENLTDEALRSGNIILLFHTYCL